MRDLLLRLGQTASDRLADVRQLDRLVRDRLLDRPRSRMRRKRGAAPGAAAERGRRLAHRGVDVGANDASARAAALKPLRSMPCACARRRASGDAFTRSPSPRGAAAGCGGAGGVTPVASRRSGAFRSRVRLWAGAAALGASAGAVSAFGAAGAARHVLALARQNCDRRADLHAVGALRHENLRDLALVDCLKLHCRLVGLDLGEDIAGIDLVALLDEPFGKRALLHRRRKGGHFEFGRHGVFPLRRTRRLKANAAGGVKGRPVPRRPLALNAGLTQH